jgi:hypothetical protein
MPRLSFWSEHELGHAISKLRDFARLSGLGSNVTRIPTLDTLSSDGRMSFVAAWSRDVRPTARPMAVKTADIPTILTHRIEAAYPAPAHFSAAEIDDWPAGVLNYLSDQGVLQMAERATSLVCPGCEWQCHKTVAVRSSGVRANAQAFIICDEEPDLGRISVAPRHLTQYRTTMAAVCSFIGGSMGLGVPRSSASGGPFLLGSIKGRQGLRQVSIGLSDGQLVLRVGRQTELVVRVLRWTNTSLSIDKPQIQRLANRKEPARPTARGTATARAPG